MSSISLALFICSCCAVALARPDKCGDREYNKLYQICCRGRLSNKPSSSYTCCDESPMPKQFHICCQVVANDREILDEMYLIAYIACDNLPCIIDDECTDSEDGCICVNTFTRPDSSGLCRQPDVHNPGHIAEHSRDGVIQFTEGMSLFDQHDSLNKDVTTTYPPNTLTAFPTHTTAVGLFPDQYFVSGLCATVLLILGISAIIYVSFLKKRRTRYTDIETGPEFSTSKSLSVSQSNLLEHSVTAEGRK